MERRNCLETYQETIKKFMNPETLSDNWKRVSNASLGLAGETGEVCDLLKKHFHHGHILDVNKFKNELGDVLFYLTEAISCVDSTLEEIAQLNVDKLTKRYPNGFTVEHSKLKLDELS